MFLSKVFANLIFQSLVTYGFAKATIEDPQMSEAFAKNALTYMIAWFIALLMFAFSKNIITRFTLFTAMSAVAGMFLGTQGNTNAKEALLDAVTIFIAMFTLGVATHMLGYELQSLGSILFIALMGLILLRLFSGKKYSELVVPLFALFVVYDTNNILRRNYEGNFVGASFDYFADILNLFSGLLNNE